MRKRISIISLVLLVLLVSFTDPARRYFDVAKNLDIFSSLFKEVNTYYVDELQPGRLVNQGIQGMLESLDPYTDYIPEEELEAFNIQTTGQYAGIGALITYINKKSVVAHPYEGFPAHRAGVRVGDEIVSVDGKNVKGKTTSEISEMLKGNPSSEISLLVSRGGKEFSFKLSRERIRIANVAYRGILDGNIGYIKLDDFTIGAAQEVQEAVITLRQQGAVQFILDLRDNPGGLLYEAVNIVNLFIPKGKEVVSTRGKVADWTKTYTTLNNPLDTDMPLIVLTSSNSASASEIVAGGLQDYDRAVLVGQRTFGKGLVQINRSIAYGGEVKVTVARYYIPSGRCIQALDYAHRRQDGVVTKFADSLKTAFKTMKGRTVYDGGGLDPDMPVVKPSMNRGVAELIESGILFDYATRYSNEHPVMDNFRSFRLSDSEYAQFEQWLKEQRFKYSSELDTELAELIKGAKQERYYEGLQTTFNSLEGKISQSHQSFTRRFRDGIQRALEEEIAFHQTLSRGKTEVSLDRDEEITTARKVFHEPGAYEKLLKPR